MPVQSAEHKGCRHGKGVDFHTTSLQSASEMRFCIIVGLTSAEVNKQKQITYLNLAKYGRSKQMNFMKERERKKKQQLVNILTWQWYNKTH